jgi:predicted acetyltransferase
LVVLEPIAKDQAPVLENLFQLYAHDFSEHVPLDLAPGGRFDVVVGAEWWTRDDHFPFFIRWNGKLSGFALVRRGSRVDGAGARGGEGAGDVMDVAEFFVVRAARKNRVGTGAAHALFTAFPGRWEIRVRRSNLSAMTFWSRVAETWVGRAVAGDPFAVEGVDWEVLRIGSPPGDQIAPATPAPAVD